MRIVKCPHHRQGSRKTKLCSNYGRVRLRTRGLRGARLCLAGICVAEHIRIRVNTLSHGGNANPTTNARQDDAISRQLAKLSITQCFEKGTRRGGTRDEGGGWGGVCFANPFIAIPACRAVSESYGVFIARLTTPLREVASGAIRRCNYSSQFE